MCFQIICEYKLNNYLYILDELMSVTNSPYNTCIISVWSYTLYFFLFFIFLFDFYCLLLFTSVIIIIFLYIKVYVRWCIYYTRDYKGDASIFLSSPIIFSWFLSIYTKSFLFPSQIGNKKTFLKPYVIGKFHPSSVITYLLSNCYLWPIMRQIIRDINIYKLKPSIMR